nr:hypothetical protein [Cronobacter muytjensii]
MHCCARRARNAQSLQSGASTPLFYSLFLLIYFSYFRDKYNRPSLPFTAAIRKNIISINIPALIIYFKNKTTTFKNLLKSIFLKSV